MEYRMRATKIPNRGIGFDHLIEDRGADFSGTPDALLDRGQQAASGVRTSGMTPPAHASTATFLAASRCVRMTDEYQQTEDIHHGGAAISTEPSDGSGLDSASDTPRGAQASDVAKEAVPQGLRTPPARQIISGGKSSSKDPEAIFDEDESIWWQYGPMPANVSGIILETKSGACIRVLNPDADLSKRWIWVPGST